MRFYSMEVKVYQGDEIFRSVSTSHPGIRCSREGRTLWVIATPAAGGKFLTALDNWRRSSFIW